jgi:hypothetical protein
MRDLLIIFIVLLVLLVIISTLGGSVTRKEKFEQSSITAKLSNAMAAMQMPQMPQMPQMGQFEYPYKRNTQEEELFVTDTIPSYDTSVTYNTDLTTPTDVHYDSLPTEKSEEIDPMNSMGPTVTLPESFEPFSGYAAI